MVDEKKKECGPCCHNGHGEKKSPVRVLEGGSYFCWLYSCSKKVAWQDEEWVWQFDPCEHVKRTRYSDIQFV